MPMNNPTAVSAGDGKLATLGRQLSAFTPAPLDRQNYHLAAPDWSAKTYEQGMVVKNGGNLYAVLGGFASTAAPTGTLTTPQADPGDGTSGAANNKGWVYIGPARTPIATEVVSYAAQSAVPSGQLIRPGDTRPLRGLTDPGALYYVDSPSAGTLPSSGKRIAAFEGAGFAGLSFVTDDPVVSAYLGGYDCAWWVDGVRVQPGTLGASAANYKVLTFSSRRMRRIRIECAGGLASLYLSASGLYQLLPDLGAMTFPWYWAGDSISGGAAPGPAYSGGHLAWKVAGELGLPPPVSVSIGGSGFWQSPSGNYNYFERIDAHKALHAAKNYKMMVLQGSGNDHAATTDANYTARVTATMALCREVAPNATIVVTGIPSGDFTTTNLTQATNTLLRTTVQTFAASDGNVIYIPCSTDTESGVALLNTTNKPLYVGVTDLHPFDSGHGILAKYIAGRIRAAAGL